MNLSNEYCLGVFYVFLTYMIYVINTLYVLIQDIITK